MKKLFLIISLSLAALLPLHAQQQLKPLKQDLHMILDNKGDAKVEASMKLPASYWDNFKSTIGNNPAILKRQMQRALPGYFLKNFNYKDDAMNSSYTLSFDALGVSQIDEKGQWVVDMNMKNPDVTKLDDHDYMITSDFNQGGTLVQQVAKLTFPANASDIKPDNNAIGRAVFYYSLPYHNWMGYIMLFIGIVLIIAGVVLFLQNQKANNKPVPVAATSQQPS